MKISAVAAIFAARIRQLVFNKLFQQTFVVASLDGAGKLLRLNIGCNSSNVFRLAARGANPENALFTIEGAETWIKEHGELASWNSISFLVRLTGDRLQIFNFKKKIGSFYDLPTALEEGDCIFIPYHRE